MLNEMFTLHNVAQFFFAFFGGILLASSARGEPEELCWIFGVIFCFAVSFTYLY